MNGSLVISFLLFTSCNLSLLAGARALEGDQVYSEAGRPLGVDDEEILARLIQEEAQGGRFDDAPNSQSGDNVEIELEPPSGFGEKETAAEQPAKNGPPATPIKKGQSEYVTFVEPANPPAQRMVDIPDLTVKRAQMDGAAPKQRSGVAASVTEMGNVVFLSVVTVCTLAAVIGMVVAGVFWQRLHKQHLAAQEAEYPAYGVIGPSKEKKNKRQNGDESMAYKAQLHHYQQTKQKIISGEETGVTGARQNESDESGDDADDGDYSVYECPGLAPTGDIEVQNPMFDSNASAKNDTAADGD